MRDGRHHETGCQMTGDKSRVRADENIEAARAVAGRVSKLVLMDVAQRWLRLATQIDGGNGGRLDRRRRDQMQIKIKTPASPGRKTLPALQVEAVATNGWLVIKSTDGRTFLLAGDIVRFNADTIEFTDDDGKHVALAYRQIASVGIGHD